MTSGTDELRRLLDERGVEWWETTSYIGATITSDGIERHYLVSTWWNSPVFGRVEATDMGDGVLHMARLNWCDFTPAQAIAATLGSCNCSYNCTNGERTETCADGGTVSETYIRPTEEGSICPIPRASVIFEGQKLTFDEEDSARFTEIVKRHLRKLAGLEVEQ